MNTCIYTHNRSIMSVLSNEITDEDNTFIRTKKRSRNVMFNFNDEQECKRQKCNDDIDVNEKVSERWFYPSTWYNKSKNKIQNILSRFMNK